jgi:hypothetical protein
MSAQEEIRRTLAEYCHCQDDMRFDDLVDLWTPDGSYTALGTTSHGREAIRTFVAGKVGDRTQGTTKHMTFNAAITLDGDSARVVSDLATLWKTATGAVVGRVGRYHDHMVSAGDRWRFADRTIVSSAWNPPGDGMPLFSDWAPPGSADR